MENYAHILQTLEKACLEFQRQPNKHNEQTLLEFRKTPGILPAAVFILGSNVIHFPNNLQLEHSKMGIIQFQAIGAITESVLRDWATMKPEEVEGVKNVLLKLVTQNINMPMSSMYIVQQALQTLAVIVKRGWIPDEDKENFPGPAQHGIFNQISQLLAGEPQYQFIAVLLCQALVLEFSSSSKSTPLGVPWAYHVLSMQTFEEHYLGKIFLLVLQLLEGIFKRGSQLQEIEVRMVSKSLNLLSTILSWPFDDYSSFLGFGFTTPTTGKSFHPGSQWNEVLVKNFNTLRFFFESYTLLRHDRTLLHMVGECLIQLASLSGDVFAKEAETLSYLNAFLPGLFHLLSLPNLSNNELLSLTRMFDRITTNFPLKLITQSQFFEPFLQNFTQFSCSVLQKLAEVDDINDRTYFNEAFDNLLEAWDFFARDADTLTGEPATRIQQYTAQIFRMYLDTKLKIARAELYEEKDEDEQQDMRSDYIQYEEQLASIANLGRLDALNAANLLTEALTERLNQANKFAQQGPASGVMIVTLLEEIHWLVIIAGGFLCDSPEGEEPSVPPAVANLSLTASSRNSPDPIMGLISILMHIANFEKDCLVNKKHDMWSPLVTETISWFLCRWTESYLLKGDHTSPSLAMAYDEPAQALSVVDFMLLKVVTNLVYMGSEEKVAKNTGDLLLAISKLKLPGPSLVGLASWKQLLELYMRLLTSDPAKETIGDVYLTIPLETQRKILCGLIKMSRKWAPNEKQSYFEQLITPLETGLIGTLQDPEFVKKSSHPGVMKKIEKYLENYRGIIQATSKENIELVFSYCSKFFQAFVQLITVYKDYYEVVALLLHVYNDFAKHAMPYLPNQAATVFINACGAFFKAFQATGLGKKAIVKNKDLHAQQEKEQYKEMLLILKMLWNLLEFEQYGGDDNSPGKWTAETVFYGLSVIIPLITRDILFFPKLCSEYYGVISSVFRCYIGQIHEIPDSLYSGIIGSLQFALKHTNNNVVSAAMEAIRALADESQVIHHPTKRESLPQLLQVLLSQILLEDNFGMDLIDAAGSALFALFFVQQDTYATFVQQLIQQTDPNNQQRLAQAFAKLTTVNPNLVNSKEEFGTSFLMEFHDFVSTARSLLKKC